MKPATLKGFFIALALIWGIAACSPKKADYRSEWQYEESDSSKNKGADDDDATKEEPAPSPGDDAGSSGTNLTKGQELFEDNCLSCHDPEGDQPIQQDTVEAYLIAIDEVPQMKGIKLEEDDLGLIQAYLNQDTNPGDSNETEEGFGGGGDDDDDDDDDNGSGTGDGSGLALDGEKIYTENCDSCHGGNYKGAPASVVQSAIDTNAGGKMGVLKGKLTTEELEAIAKL